MPSHGYLSILIVERGHRALKSVRVGMYSLPTTFAIESSWPRRPGATPGSRSSGLSAARRSQVPCGDDLTCLRSASGALGIAQLTEDALDFSIRIRCQCWKIRTHAEPCGALTVAFPRRISPNVSAICESRASVLGEMVVVSCVLKT